MVKETEIKWGKTANKKGDFIVLEQTSSDYKERNIERLKINKLHNLGVHGYIDENKAIKIYDPSHSRFKRGLNFKQHTLTKGDDGMTSNEGDKYSELKEDLRESERRISNDIREREDRFEREMVRREERFEKSLEKYAEDAKEREERYIKSIDEIKQIVSDGEKNRKSTTIAMWTLAITTLIGIAAMVITVVVTA